MSDELKRFLSKTLEEKRKDADRLREKYPDKVPVIVQVAKSSEIPQTRKPKYLMPKSISIGKVQTILRDYLKDQDFDESKALFIFVKDVMPMISETLGDLDDQHRNEDGFLYLSYSGENTFGAQ